MPGLRDLSIKRKLIGIIVLTSSVALLMACVAFTVFDWISTKRSMVANLGTLSGIIANNSVAALEFDDIRTAAEMLQLLATEQHLAAAAIYRVDGSVLAQYSRGGHPFVAPPIGDAQARFEEDRLVCFHPVVFDDVPVGTVYLQSDLGELESRRSRYVQIVTIFIVTSFVVALLVAGILQSLISRPILDLVEAVHNVRDHRNYAVRVAAYGGDEIGSLMSGFNEMLNEIEGRDRVLKQTRDELAMRAGELQVELAERQRAEEALRQSEEANRALLDAVPDLMFRFDRNGVYLDARASEDDLLLPAERVVGQSLSDLLPPRVARQAMASLRRALTSGATETLEYDLDIGGQTCYFEARLSPVAGDEVFAIVRDITEQRVAERARREAEMTLEQQRTLSMRSDRLRSLGEMAAGIAHELNQPLMGVRGIAEHCQIALSRRWILTEDTLRQRLNAIVEQADRMSHIIEHVRMFAREAGGETVQSIDVNEVVHSTLGMISAQFGSHGLQLDHELGDDLPSVEANQFSLEEVLLNLINNARDAVEGVEHAGAGRPSRVLVRTALDDDGCKGRVRIDVVDNGTGIPPEVLPKVFDPFFTTKDPDKGTGLGLAVSKSIIEEFGGELRIESSPGRGTTSSVFLPPNGRA